MPELDVSFMVADPAFADDFVIVRRAEKVTSKGRSEPTAEQRLPAWGTIVQDEGNDLQRVADGQTAARRIKVYTQSQIIGPVVGRQPDIIEWAGTSYLVTSVMPYARFGAGFYEVSAASIVQPDQSQ